MKGKTEASLVRLQPAWPGSGRERKEREAIAFLSLPEPGHAGCSQFAIPSTSESRDWLGFHVNLN